MRKLAAVGFFFLGRPFMMFKLFGGTVGSVPSSLLVRFARVHHRSASSVTFLCSFYTFSRPPRVRATFFTRFGARTPASSRTPCTASPPSWRPVASSLGRLSSPRRRPPSCTSLAVPRATRLVSDARPRADAMDVMDVPPTQRKWIGKGSNRVRKWQGWPFTHQATFKGGKRWNTAMEDGRGRRDEEGRGRKMETHGGCNGRWKRNGPMGSKCMAQRMGGTGDRCINGWRG